MKGKELNAIADIEITDSLMLIDTKNNTFNMQRIRNRRFMFSPDTGELILGKQYRGRQLVASHAEEHGSSGAAAPFDSFIRGWIGTGKECPQGVIHFAPAIDSRNAELFDRAFDALSIFRDNGALGGTVIRGFGESWEQPLENIIPFTERSERMSNMEARPFILTATDTEGKVKEITERLEAGVKDLFESERYQNYLKAMSKFHDYSLNNTLLIVMQKPDASLVAGYTKWRKEFERHVKAEENGIKILAPAHKKIRKEVPKVDPDTGKPVVGADGKPVMEQQEITIPRYKVVTVFDVSQTDGKEIPDIAVDTLTGNVEQYEDFWRALKETSPVPVELEKIESGAHGYYHLEDKRIAIDDGMSELQTIKTLIHEIAHAKLHDIDLNMPRDEQENRPTRRTREVEAESIAYTVCQHYGLDTSDYSFGYVAGWSSDKEIAELKASLETIRKTAGELITEIDGHFNEIQQQRAAQSSEQSAEQRPVFENLSHTQQQEIRDTVQDTLQMLVDMDLQSSGFVTQGTLDALEAQGYMLQDGEVQRKPTKEYEYQIHANPRTTGEENRQFVQAYEKTGNGELLPQQVLFIGSPDECRELVGRLEQGEPMQGLDSFPVISAVRSNYTDMVALVGIDKRVYLGKRENYDNHGHYDNRDNSLLYISGNEKIYGLLYGEGCILSQQDALRLGVYSKEDLAEFAALQDGILSGLEQTRQYLFDGKPLDMSQVDMGADIPPVPYKQAIREIAAIIDGRQQDTPEKIAAEVFDLSVENDPAFMEKYAATRDAQIASTAESLMHSPNDTAAVQMVLLHIAENGSSEEIRQRAAELNRRIEAFEEKNNTFSIYQLKGGEETRDYRFEPLERLKAAGLSVQQDNYDLVYTASLSPGETLEDLFVRFNMSPPQDFTGHSLSMSDIIVQRHGNKETAHYLDRGGYTEVPEFLQQMRNAQRWNGMDGIINDKPFMPDATPNEQANALIDHAEQDGQRMGNAERGLIIRYHEAVQDIPKTVALINELCEQGFEQQHGHLNYLVKERIDAEITATEQERRQNEPLPPSLDPAVQPVVTILWSESAKVRDGEQMPLARAEVLFKSLDDEKRAERVQPGHTGGWYDKTKFHIDFTFQGERDSYEGRQDFGDGDGTLIDHIEAYHQYYAQDDSWKNYIVHNEGKDAWEQEQSQRQMILSEFVPYLRLHCNLYEQEQTAAQMLENGTELTPEQAAYFNAVLDHVDACREKLNAGDYKLPDPPRISDFTQATEMEAYKAHVREEIEQEAAAAGMTVEEYAANGYEPREQTEMPEKDIGAVVEEKLNEAEIEFTHFESAEQFEAWVSAHADTQQKQQDTPAAEVSAEQPEKAPVRYYSINEAAARHANDANSFRDYTPGSATAEYRRMVDHAAELAQAQKERVDPMYHDKIDSLLDTYSRRLAENMNKSYAIEGRIPSVLIAGGSNFPVRRKEKQNVARGRNMEEWQDIQGLLDKIRSTGMGGISADDPQAVAKLEAKLESLVQSQEMMKGVNAYFRKHKTLDGCTLLPPEQIAELQRDMAQSWHLDKSRPFQSFQLSNNNAEIHRLRERIESLNQHEVRGYAGWEFDGGRVEANREANRLQIFFDDKPDSTARDELKANGFRWAPSAGAWQRQLNANAYYAADRITCIQPSTGERPTALQIKAQREARTQREQQDPQPMPDTPDKLMTGEQITTPRGSFHVTAMSVEQMRQAGYGVHHTSEDGKYHIMGNGTQAFAVAVVQPEQAAQKEPENYLKAAELSTEQNYNMIDQQINNTPSVDELEEKAKRGEVISLSALAAAVKAEDSKTPQRESDGKKPSIRAQLKADKAQAAKKSPKEQEAKRSIRQALEME